MKTRSKRISESPIEDEDDRKSGLSPIKRQKIKKPHEDATSNSQRSKSQITASNESSDSSSDEYLVPSHKLDLNSDFFKIQKNDFSEIESTILKGVNRLSDSDDSCPEDLKPIYDSKADGTNCDVENNSCKKGKDSNCVSNKQPSDGVDKRVGKSPIVSKTKRQKITDQKKESAALVEVDINDMNISQLLALGERPSTNVICKDENKTFKMDMHSPVKNESKCPVNSKKGSAGKKCKLSIKAKAAGSPRVKVKSEDSQMPKNVKKLRKADGKLGTKIAEISIKKESESDDLSEWEEVKDNEPPEPQTHVFPADGIQVTVEMPEVSRHKKKGLDIAAYMRKKINQVKRDIQVLMHKVHLLCWIAHGNYVNSVINSEVLMGVSLSLMPSEHCYPDKRTDMKYLQQVTQWFSKSIKVEERDQETTNSVSLVDDLQKEFETKIAYSKRELVFMFICMMRSLGVSVRLVISLQPVPLKPSANELYSEKTKDELEEGKKSLRKEKSESDKPKVAKGKAKKSLPVAKPDDGTLRKRRDVMSKVDAVNIIKKCVSDKEDSKSNTSRRKEKVTGISSGGANSSKPYQKQAVKATQKHASQKLECKSNRLESQENVICQSVKNRKGPNSPKKITSKLRERKYNKKYVDDRELSDSNESDLEKSVSPRDSKNSKMPLRLTQHKTPIYSAKNKGKSGEGDDSDYSPELVRNKRSSATSDRRVLSTDSDEVVPVTLKKKDRCDVWAEVYLESEEKWISVDVNHGQIHCVRELFSRATQPVRYILAWNNNMTIKDVTQRYCAQWHSVTRKQRVDENWWLKSLKPYRGRRTAKDKAEEKDIQRQLHDRPLPTSIGEFKDHPLYVLKRHLLKFQAIYPPDAPTLGFVRGEPIYARECVYTLHSREIWLKEAKVVKLGETPYKIVKARPKYDRMSGRVVKDLPLEIFGIWQVEDYVPPPAVDGKIPRNAYGNVELFKPCMLPGGTVHLRLPGLNRVARKLQIDCAPAVIGFDYHSGSSHPTFDGFIVCKEFKKVLVDAWEQEQEEADRRYEEKRMKRIYGNWKRLIRGLLIRERLNQRYSFGKKPSTSSEPKPSGSNSKSKKINKKKRQVISSDESN